MEDNKNYERGEHLENITDASMKDDDYFNASRNIDRKYITIEGARENNLKNINVKIPRDKFVVVTGLSGSGKSSLAFDTIYAEGQRRYMESLSSYARQFLGQAEKPDVDKIEGLSPAISIDQKSTNRNPRSTVGTVTEIYDYFRLLYARVGIPHCPNCGKVISRQTVDQMVDEIMKLPERTKFMVLAPVVRGRKGEHVKLLEKAKKSGFVRVVVDGSMYELSEEIKLDKNKKHSIDIVVDRLVVRQDVERRLTDSIETALQLAEGLMKIEVIGERDENGVQKENTIINFSDSFSCPDCGISIDEIEPRSFSFNNPFGACPTCAGLGFKMEFDPDLMIPDQSLSINDGAIVVLGWQSCNDGKSYSNAILRALSAEYGFSLDTPFQEYPQDIKDLLLYGKNSRPVKVHYKGQRGEGVYDITFEGLIKSVARRYRETSAESTKAEYETFMTVTPCEVCGGKRLKPTALAVTVGDKNIAELTELPITELAKFMKDLELTDRQKMIGAAILKEIRSRLHFLIDVGLDYLCLSRGTSTLSGGEAQRIKLATELSKRSTGKTLYILDEPLGGVDPATRDYILDTILTNFNDGASVIISTHLIADIERILDEVIFIDKGRIILQSDADVLREKEKSGIEEVFRRMFKC